MKSMKLNEIKTEPVPTCPSCKKSMKYYGGTAGYICCEWKLLYGAHGWLNQNGDPVYNDHRLARHERR